MKKYIVFMFCFAASIAWGQNYSINSYKMSIKGSSNVHEWESNVTEVRAKSTAILDENGLKELQSLYVEIPVKSIKSPKGSVMDGKTYDALLANKYPNITFKLEKASITPKSGYFDCNTTGYLTIAGVTKKVSIYAKGKVNGDAITYSGSKKLKMTDFNIDPPTALMGTMTTGDDIEIVFSITLKKN